LADQDSHVDAFNNHGREHLHQSDHDCRGCLVEHVLSQVIFKLYLGSFLVVFKFLFKEELLTNVFCVNRQ
jgi:hypothetical protein